MHVIVIRSDILARHPWLAMNLYKAFEEAKRRSIERLSEITASHAPFALARALRRSAMKALFGEDFWPYGLEKNRKTLQGFRRLRVRAGRLPPPAVASRGKLVFPR